MKPNLKMIWAAKRWEFLFLTLFWSLGMFGFFLWLGWTDFKSDSPAIAGLLASTLLMGAVVAFLMIIFAPTEDQATDETAIVDRLIAIYRTHPQGFIAMSSRPEVEEIHLIGTRLDARGGKALMLKVHVAFAARCGVPGAPRNLEIIWDGIGSWQG